MVVGDQRGILQLISIKKGEPFVDFKVELKSPVNCVTVHVNSNGKSIIWFLNASITTFFLHTINLFIPPSFSCIGCRTYKRNYCYSYPANSAGLLNQGQTHFQNGYKLGRTHSAFVRYSKHLIVFSLVKICLLLLLGHLCKVA